MKAHYDIEYRLDDMDSDCEYSDEFRTKAEAIKECKKLDKQYGDRLVMADIKKWCDDEEDSEYGCLIDMWTFK